MQGVPSSKKDSGTGLRLRMLAYFLATIVVMVALASYAFQLHKEQNTRLMQLRIEGHGLQQLHGKVTNTLNRELRAWKDLLLRGEEQGLYHEMLKNYYQAERISRQAIGELTDSLTDDPELELMAKDLQEAHFGLSRQRREALRIYNATALDAHTVADRLTRNMEENPTDLLSSLSSREQSLRNAREVNIEKEMQLQRDILIFEGLLLTGLALLGFFLLVDRQVGRPAQQAAELAALIQQAEDVAKFGIWEWDLRDGRQSWSPGMYNMLAIDPTRFPPAYAEYRA